MSPSLPHFLLTKLNLPMCGDGRHLRSDWIARRLELLARHTAPSAKRQTEPFDAWLLLCAAGTAPEDKAAILRSCERLGCVAVWIEEGALIAQLRRTVRELAPDSSSRVLTSRLDSDDVLHPQFAERVRARAGGDFTGFVNPLFGLHYVRGALYLWPYVASNFVSYVEPLGGELKTVMALSHDRIYRAAPVRQIVSRPLWLVVTHGRNTSTVARRGIRTTAAGHLDDFPILSELGIDPDLSAVKLRGCQLLDTGRLVLKAMRGGSRARLLGGMKSVVADLSRARGDAA
jgi:hypothetical protein